MLPPSINMFNANFKDEDDLDLPGHSHFCTKNIFPQPFHFVLLPYPFLLLPYGVPSLSILLTTGCLFNASSFFWLLLKTGHLSLLFLGFLFSLMESPFKPVRSCLSFLPLPVCYFCSSLSVFHIAVISHLSHSVATFSNCRSGVGKTWPTDCIWSARDFHVAHGLPPIN